MAAIPTVIYRYPEKLYIYENSPYFWIEDIHHESGKTI